MEEKVLVPIDGSPLSHQALRHAIEKFQGARVIVFHVVNILEPEYEIDETSLRKLLAGSGEWGAIEQEAADHLLSEAEEIASEYDREITTDSEIGDPQRLIPDYARENDIDHIVMGVHGRDEEERSFVGQVAETVFFRAPVSVTTIR
jgi:nucleotide-binding universal stress UspA family protein